MLFGIFKVTAPRHRDIKEATACWEKRAYGRVLTTDSLRSKFFTLAQLTMFITNYILGLPATSLHWYVRNLSNVTISQIGTVQATVAILDQYNQKPPQLFYVSLQTKR
jgi:hypothetical protein